MKNLIIEFFVNIHIIAIIFVDSLTFTAILVDILVYGLRNNFFN